MIWTIHLFRDSASQPVSQSARTRRLFKRGRHFWFCRNHFWFLKKFLDSRQATETSCHPYSLRVWKARSVSFEHSVSMPMLDWLCCLLKVRFVASCHSSSNRFERSETTFIRSLQLGIGRHRHILWLQYYSRNVEHRKWGKHWAWKSSRVESGWVELPAKFTIYVHDVESGVRLGFLKHQPLIWLLAITKGNKQAS